MKLNVAMQLRIAIQCCPIENINPKKERGTLLLGAEACERYDSLYYYTTSDLFLENGTAYAWARKVKIDHDKTNHIHILDEIEKLNLNECDVILIRQNPPMNQDYLMSTYILDHVGSDTLILNSPEAIRNFNGKIFANEFKDYIVPYAMGNNINTFLNFYNEHKDIILKPMNGFGGEGIYRITKDCNPEEIFEEFRENNKSNFIAQQYIPEAAKGDKRITLFDGEPVAALLRVPAAPGMTGNVAMGAKTEKTEITEREYNLCRTMAPILQKRGLFFVGIDMLGDYLVEVNLISPGTIRSTYNLYGIELEKTFWDKVEQKLEARQITRTV